MGHGRGHGACRNRPRVYPPGFRTRLQRSSLLSKGSFPLSAWRSRPWTPPCPHSQNGVRLGIQALQVCILWRRDLEGLDPQPDPPILRMRTRRAWTSRPSMETGSKGQRLGAPKLLQVPIPVSNQSKVR